MNGISLLNKLDEMLKRDEFDTRAGLYFMGELVKDAIQYIEDRRANDRAAETTLGTFESRVRGVENKLDQFLQRRDEEQKSAADERKFYRRAVIGGIITILLSQVAQWVLR